MRGGVSVDEEGSGPQVKWAGEDMVARRLLICRMMLSATRFFFLVVPSLSLVRLVLDRADNS